MSKLLLGIVFVSLGTVACAATISTKVTGHSNPYPFTVEAGNSCYGLANHSPITATCQGADKIYYIGSSSEMLAGTEYCKYDMASKSWVENPAHPLVPGPGFYACTTS